MISIEIYHYKDIQEFFMRSNFIRLFFLLLLVLPISIIFISDMLKEKKSDVFPYRLIEEFELADLKEPSGIIFNPLTKTLFVVGDKGHLYEVRCDGSLLRGERILKADFEGITCNPMTGILYIAVEGEEDILEVEPKDFTVKRKFDIEQNFQGDKVLRPGGDGIEGITFIPDNNHPEGGTFYITNQGDKDDESDDLSAIMEIYLPLKSSFEKVNNGKIIRYFTPSVTDMSGLYYNPVRKILYVISDDNDLFIEFTKDLEFLDGYGLPGEKQEGITFDNDGFLYIAQDSGGILKFEPLR